MSERRLVLPRTGQSYGQEIVMYNPFVQWMRFEQMMMDAAFQWQRAMIDCSTNLIGHQINLLAAGEHRRDDDGPHDHFIGPRGAWWLDHYGNRSHDVDVEKL